VIDPALKRSYDELISQKLVTAEQSLFMAAGAFVLYAYEPRQSAHRFYSPVGADRSWMQARPLYRYLYVDPFVGGRFAGPLEPFFRYQEVPVVKLALDSLDKINTTQPSLVWAEEAYIWDLFSEPSARTARRAPLVFAEIARIRQ
jgi:hypothetical protein